MQGVLAAAGNHCRTLSIVPPAFQPCAAPSPTRHTHWPLPALAQPWHPVARHHRKGPALAEEQVAWFRHAKTAQKAGDAEHALAILRQGLARWPNDRHMLSLASSLHVKAGQLYMAEQLLRIGLRLYPQHLPLLIALGKFQAAMSNFTAARQTFQQAASRFRSNGVLMLVSS